MKKVLFVVVMLLVASTCFAQLQSGPSNVVGYVKIQCAAGSSAGVSTAFGLPFKFWDVLGSGVPNYGVVSTNPSDIIGDQPRCGSVLTSDQIVRQDGGAAAYRSGTQPACTGATWTGSLETGAAMIPGKAYWYKNKQVGVQVNLVLAGEVDNSGSYYTAPGLAVPQGATAYTSLSWRDSRSVNRNALNLVTSGFNGGTGGPLASDRIAAQVGGGQAYLTSGGAWTGTLVTVEPGSAYWIHNRANGGVGAYNYQYVPGGALDAVGGSAAIKMDNSSVSKVSAPVSPTKTKVSSGNAK